MNNYVEQPLGYWEEQSYMMALLNGFEGDFFEMEGKRYIVCDPTYIGAAVGRTMPDCKDLECEIIKL